MSKINSKQVTPYQDINEILYDLANNIKSILNENLVGLYLFGSLSYGDFNSERSDIDIVAILNKSLTQPEIQLINKLHEAIKKKYPKWSERIECSYTPIDMLKNILPPQEPRPYFGGGILYDEAPYGNEWIINNYLLYQHGIALIGRDFKSLMPSIDIYEVQKACIRDLFQEWEPKINDFEWLDNSHYQSYLVLNLCRILYTVMEGIAGTKKASAEWAINTFSPSWNKLIEGAQAWQYGNEMSSRGDSINFIKFTIDKIKHTDIYRQMNCKK